MTEPREISLQFLVKFRSGQDYKHVDDPAGSVPVYGSGGIFASASDYLYDGESVLFGRKGTIDRPAYVCGKFWTVDTMFYTELREGVSGRWLYYWATTIPFGLYSTDTALPSMTSSVLGRIKAPLVPHVQQCAIADYLDREIGEIDAMLAALDELTRNLKQRSGIVVANELKSHYLHGTIPLAFSSGADNFFDGDWVESKDQDPDGDIRLLQLADIGDGTFLDKSNRRINQEAFERLRCREVQEGDILIARMPHPLGRACILPTGLGRTITVVDVAVLRPDPNRVIPKYLVYVLNSISFRAQLDSLQSGSTRQRISRSRLGQQRIPMPPVALQRAAVSHLDEVTGRINAMLAKIDELKALLVERRAALITDVVTGRKKVPA
ncbi:MAG: restriction endonuclease subunit S [Pauljensenia sp.]|nr:restriction endonuclease subunit S [Pauljensenia sp.]